MLLVGRDDFLIDTFERRFIQFLSGLTKGRRGDGAFLSRIEDKGEIIQLESAVPESPDSIRQVAQYIKQEILQ